MKNELKQYKSMETSLSELAKLEINYLRKGQDKGDFNKIYEEVFEVLSKYKESVQNGLPTLMSNSDYVDGKTWLIRSKNVNENFKFVKNQEKESEKDRARMELNSVVTFAEATEILGKSISYMNRLVDEKKVVKDVDYRVAGRIKLIKVDSVDKILLGDKIDSRDIPLDAVMTFAEATEYLGKSVSYLNALVKFDKIKEGVHFRKAGRIKLIRRSVVEQLKNERC